MRQLIALLVVLMIGALGGLFTWFAYAIRRDVRERFQRIQQQLQDEATRLMSHVLRRRNPTETVSR